MPQTSWDPEYNPKSFTQGVEFKQPVVFPPVVNSQVRASAEVVYVLNIADAATADYDIIVEDAFEVAEVVCQKRGAAGAGNTVQVKKGATAISDAIACATDTNITRSATIDDAQSSLAAGDTLRTTVTRAAGNGACLVTIRGVRR
jgi:hypothetical protein